MLWPLRFNLTKESSVDSKLRRNIKTASTGNNWDNWRNSRLIRHVHMPTLDVKIVSVIILQLCWLAWKLIVSLYVTLVSPLIDIKSGKNGDLNQDYMELDPKC